MTSEHNTSGIAATRKDKGRFFYMRENALREVMLSRLLEQATASHRTVLLSFATGKEGYWSFDFEKVVRTCIERCGETRLDERLEVRRISRASSLSPTFWEELSLGDAQTVIFESLTDAVVEAEKDGVRLADIFPLMLEQCREKQVLFVDQRAPPREIASFIRAITPVQSFEELKQVVSTEKGAEERSQSSISRFSDPLNA